MDNRERYYLEYLLVKIFVFLLPLFSYGQCPLDTDFVEIEVKGGSTIHGSISIRLTYDGLIYRWADESWNKNILFIHIDSLRNDDVCEIQEYIWKKELIQIPQEYLLATDSGDYDLRRKWVINIFNPRSNQMNTFTYKNFDRKIEDLITLLIDIVPEYHQQYFTALRR